MTNRTFQTEFPDFPAADIPTMPEGFVDESWHNDTMPCFINRANGLCIWVDYVDVSAREYGGGKRFSVAQMAYDAEHGYQSGDSVDLFATDEWEVVLASLPNFYPKAA